MKRGGIAGLAVLATVITAMIAGPAAAKVIDKKDTINGMTVEYQVVLPNHYDPNKAYPAVLAFPPGDQAYDLMDSMVSSIWEDEAEKRGYLVITLAAANGDQRYFEGGAKIFPAFFDKIAADYKILGGKFHIAGVSAGGTSAFWIAALYPEKFWSVTGFPGSLWEPTPERMKQFANMCVYMYVGAEDQERVRKTMAEQAAQWRAQGMKPFFSVVKGEEHVIVRLTFAGAAPLFQQFDRARKGQCG